MCKMPLVVVWEMAATMVFPPLDHVSFMIFVLLIDSADIFFPNMDHILSSMIGVFIMGLWGKVTRSMLIDWKLQV